MQVNAGDKAEAFHSLDDIYYFGGQFGECWFIIIMFKVLYRPRITRQSSQNLGGFFVTGRGLFQKFYRDSNPQEPLPPPRNPFNPMCQLTNLMTYTHFFRTHSKSEGPHV
jgi:hypothetical protein